MRRVIPSLLPVALLFCLILPGVLSNAAVRKQARHVLLVRDALDISLDGISVPSKKPMWSVTAWRLGDFQAEFNKWFGQNFGFRPFMARLDNQIGYSVFHKSNLPSTKIIVGRDKMLYEKDYITEYCGLVSPPSNAQLERLASDLNEVGARFRARGVGFVVFITPSKAAIYPENIPAGFLSKSPLPRSYDRFTTILKKYPAVNYADGHAALIAAKAAYPAPQNPALFCRGGIHYNDWGMLFALRPLMQALEKESGRPTPPLSGTFPVPEDRMPSANDADLANLLNLYYPPVHYLNPHPNLKFDHTKIKENEAGRLLMVGGSFCRQPLRLFDTNHVFARMDFYYYYHISVQHFPGAAEVPTSIAALDWEKTFLNTDVVVLEINETKLGVAGNTHYREFLRDAKRHLPPAASASRTEKRPKI